jgi:hypothetical protein
MTRAGAMRLVKTPNSPGTPTASRIRGQASNEVLPRGLTEPAVTAMAVNIDDVSDTCARFGARECRRDAIRPG